MLNDEAFCGRITKNLYRVLLNTKYEPEYVDISYLLKVTDIDRSTILKWCRDNKIKNIYGKVGSNSTKIHLADFVTYVLYKYRYCKFKGNRGKWWKEHEIKHLKECGKGENDKNERSGLAKRIKRHRINKMDKVC